MLGRLLFVSLPALFSLTLFLSAGLLFLVELMIAKLILPLFGGTPAVWNTCMMFFQAVLLAGYGYAHISGTKAKVDRQIVLHLAILVAACIVLPISIPRHWGSSAEGNPIGTMLLLLLSTVGLPFFVLSATAPLLQQWFARTGHPSANDPYFLYSASNLGSMLALISYPTWMEPHFRLAVQSRAWTIGYLIILALTAFCAGLTRKYIPAVRPANKGMEEDPAGPCLIAASSPYMKPPPLAKGGASCFAEPASGMGVTSGERSRWVLLAFVPSSLMLGVTTFLSTDVAAIPLFWIIPLSLYLLSFIIVFARIPAMVHRAMVLFLPVSVTALIFVNFSDIGILKWVVFIFHLVNFFVYCMVCHGEIARSRPPKEQLTEFYFWISVGGVLGGIFNALVAPIAFNAVLEYPLVLALGAMLLPIRKMRLGKLPNWKSIPLYLVVPLALAWLTYWATMQWPVKSINLDWFGGLLPIDRKLLDPIVTYGLLGLLCYGLVFLKKPYLFGMGIAALLMTIVVSKDFTPNIVHQVRSFFGVITLTTESDGALMNLSHGGTIHGRQWKGSDKRLEPLAYYHREGPVGQVFAEFSGEKQKSRIAVTGLGAGAIAAYAGSGQELHFYEIDPAVKMIAINPEYFTYLNDCRADWKIILGDARLTMEQAPPHYYGIIILDAFSSDAIPMHLLTKEAMDLYFSKLSEDGLLLVHISNKYVDLAPVLAEVAREKRLAGRICDDDGDDENEKYGSTWVALARKEDDLGGLAMNSEWKKIEPRKTVKMWTDDFSNILSVFKW